MSKKIGLALGSGGARGWAHIGVIRALERAGIPIDYIAGASIGAFVGAIYAAGELDELEEFVRDLNWKMILSLFDVVFPTCGLLDGNKIYDLLTEHLQELCIEEAGIPFCCVATDLITGKEVLLRSGKMADAVRASISIPGIFTPFAHEGLYLGDGGIVNPVPVQVVRDMGADIVIAVNLNHMDPEAVKDQPEETEIEEAFQRRQRLNAEGELIEEETNLITRIRKRYQSLQEGIQQKISQWIPDEPTGPNIFDVIGTTLNVMEQSITRSVLAQHPPDLLLQPNLSRYGIFDFHEADPIIRAGYRQMRRAIPELRQKLEG
ncbi:patatin family protein [Synechococcus sp. Nb3U1]|uniref:patatin family protein n=1 Tax=Synechococcus sp. Nb3U1 TaxID=1914529 RepID=UPI001F19AA00|nr:patatin family protein [Synechococcus sp. Nb3U1]MCF2969659.1 patatin family protein [Synechococcus sp. Nb3U1]